MFHEEDGIRYVITRTSDKKCPPSELVRIMWQLKIYDKYKKMISGKSTEEEKRKALIEAEKIVKKEKTKSVGKEFMIDGA